MCPNIWFTSYNFIYSAKGATKSDKIKLIRLACITKVRQGSKKKTTNHHCILEQCKQIVFPMKHCFKFCLKTYCEHSTSNFDSITSIHILPLCIVGNVYLSLSCTPDYEKSFAVSFHSHELFYFWWNTNRTNLVVDYCDTCTWTDPLSNNIYL